MSTSNTNTAPTTVTPSDSIIVNGTTLLNTNLANITKLSTTNYLMWNRQVHSLLDGYGLAPYLDGSLVVPEPVRTINGVTSTNPDYVIWKRQDKLIFSAVLGAISIAIQPILSRAQTSIDILSMLATTYAKPICGHIKQVQHQLKQSTKGSKTVDEYVQGLVMKFDQLAILGKVIEHEDQIDFILEGLPEEYKSVVDQMNGRDTPPTIPALHEKLLNHEATLLVASESVILPITANYASNRNRNNNTSPINDLLSPTTSGLRDPT